MVSSIALTALALSSLAMSAELKIAVVDIDGAVAASHHQKKIFEKLEKEFGPAQTDLKSLQKEIIALEERYVKDAAIMGETEARRLQQELAEKQSRLKFEGVELQRKSQKRYQELHEPVLILVKDAMKEFEKEGKYDLILHKQMVLVSKDHFDLTKKLTEKLNKK
jgi:Skp family chaperone for outer membrane proteins